MSFAQIRALDLAVRAKILVDRDAADPIPEGGRVTLSRMRVTARDVAEAIGEKHSQWCRYARGEYLPRAEQLAGWLDAVGLLLVEEDGEWRTIPAPPEPEVAVEPVTVEEPVEDGPPGEPDWLSEFLS